MQRESPCCHVNPARCRRRIRWRLLFDGNTQERIECDRSRNSQCRPDSSTASTEDSPKRLRVAAENARVPRPRLQRSEDRVDGESDVASGTWSVPIVKASYLRAV